MTGPDYLTLSGNDSSADIQQTDLQWYPTEEIVHYSVTGNWPETNAITLMDAANNAFSGTITVIDSRPPLATLYVTATPATENGGDGNFHFALRNPDESDAYFDGNPITYSYGGSAVAGRNFTDLGTITPTAGTSFFNVPVHALDNNSIDQSLDLSLTVQPTGAYNVDTSGADCTIVDGDSRTVSVDSPTFDVGGTGTLHVTVTGGFSGVVPLNLSYDASSMTISPDGDPTLSGDSEVQSFTISASAPGSFDVTVTDPAHNQGGGTVTVNDATPDTPVISAIDATVATPWNGAVATFTSADQNVDGSYFTALVDYGDGTTPRTATVTGDNGSFTVTDSHIFPTAQRAPLSITITSAGGATSNATDDAGVVAVKLPAFGLTTVPEVELTAGEIYSGFVGIVDGVFDPNGSFETSTVTISDGSGGSVTVANPAVDASFGGFSPGTYTAVMTVTENVSDPHVQAVSSSGTFTIHVSGHLGVTATPITADYDISTGQIGVATFIDDDALATSFSATIDWGDGASEGTIYGMGVRGTHTYMKAGNFIMTVTVHDNDGNEGQDSVEAVVGPFLTVTATADAYEYGSDGNFHFDLTSAFGGSYIAPKDITVSNSYAGTAVAGTDYQAPGSVTIKKDDSSADGAVHALTDNPKNADLTAIDTPQVSDDYQWSEPGATCDVRETTVDLTATDHNNTKNTVTVTPTTSPGDIYVPEINTGADAGSASVDLSLVNNPGNVIINVTGNGVTWTPGPQGTATLKPSGNNATDWDYQVTAGPADGETIEILTIHVFRLQVGDNNKNPLVNSVVGLVGRKVILWSVLTGDAPTPTAWNWDIPGAKDASYNYAIKDYDPAAASPAPTSLADADFLNQSVQFYWIAPFADNRAVSVTMTFGNNKLMCVASQDFSVAVPKSTFSADTLGKAGVVLDQALGRWALHFGLFDVGAVKNPHGIDWKATASAPPGAERGFFQVVQKAVSTRTITVGNQTFKKDTGPTGANDGDTLVNPVIPQYEPPVEVPASGAEASLSDNDSPPSGLIIGVTKLVVSDQFTDYLMYKPDGGIWVTLKVLSWQWGGTVNSINAANNAWALDPNSVVAPAAHIDSGDSYMLPTWNGGPGGLKTLQFVPG